MSRERLYSKGDAIGPYEVARVLDSGAMGTLYEARPDPVLRRGMLERGIERVAVKVARAEPRPSDRERQRTLMERADREARLLLELTQRRHPNVIEVYDFGFQDGAPFYVMAYVEGVTLEETLASRPRLGAMLRVFVELCDAVAFLHGLGIRHRDIKPSNVMVPRDGGGSVLIDFGVCLPPVGRRLTNPHELVGTSVYLSPEHAAHWLYTRDGRPYLAEPTDDVWALGIVLYEILTGGTPWKTSPDRREALLREIHACKVAHPSDVNPDIPRALGDVAMRLLAERAWKRPGNGTEVLELLAGAVVEVGDIITRVPERRREEWGGAADGSSGDGPGGAGGGVARWFFGALKLAMMGLVVAGAFWLGESGIHRVLESRTSTARETVIPRPESLARESLEGARRVVAQQAARATPSPPPMVGLFFLQGMKLPEKPKPTWIRPGPDGVCRNPLTGELLGLVTVLRGACFETTSRATGDRSCPPWVYDPPPEVLNDPKLKGLHNACFRPYELNATSQSVTPTNP